MLCPVLGSEAYLISHVLIVESSATLVTGKRLNSGARNCGFRHSRIAKAQDDYLGSVVARFLNPLTL